MTHDSVGAVGPGSSPACPRLVFIITNRLVLYQFNIVLVVVVGKDTLLAHRDGQNKRKILGKMKI